jgi:hypothetical protein
MRFRLTYHDDLKSSGNRSQPEAKWVIRNAIHSQLAELWTTHPALSGVGLTTQVIGNAFISDSPLIGTADIDVTTPRTRVRAELAAPIERDGRSYIPLVRKSMELACGLDILFLRREEPGSIVSQSGDLDGRIKTLFDGLTIPQSGDLNAGAPSAQPCYCLLENDSLVVDFAVRTDRLLSGIAASKYEVMLVIDVVIRMMRITSHNIGFFGD